MERVPLYKIFGKFMGKRITGHDENMFNKIRSCASEFDLKVRINDPHIKADIGNHTDRLNVIIKRNSAGQKVIDEITIG